VTDASIDMGAAFEAGIKENFPNAEITFDKFHVVKLANEAVDQVRREEARNNFQIKGQALHFPQERRSSDAGGKGGAVPVGGAEPGHDPGDADPNPPRIEGTRDLRRSVKAPCQLLSKTLVDLVCWIKALGRSTRSICRLARSTARRAGALGGAPMRL
jgi:hypothetical protein